MTDNSGFFLYQDEQWHHARGEVLLFDGTRLTRATKDNFQYPIHGWFWSDTLPNGYPDPDEEDIELEL